MPVRHAPARPVGEVPAVPPSRQPALRLLLAATAASFTGYALLLPVVPMWAAHTGASESGAGATTGVFMGATVAGQLAMPWLLRRTGYRRALLTGALLLGLPAPLLCLSFSLEAVLAVCVLRGLGLALLTVAGSALAAEVVPPELRGKAVGGYGLALGLPQLAGLPLGPWLATHWGFTPVFLAGLLPVAATLPVALIRHPGVRGPSLRASDPVSARGGTIRRMSAPWAVMLGVTVGAGAQITFVPSYAPHGTGPLALFALTAAMLGARWWAGLLADRRGCAGRLLTASTAMAVAGSSMTTLAFGLPGARLSGAALLVGGSALVGAAFGAVQAASLLLMFAQAGSSGYARASTLWNIAYDGGTGLGAALLGAIAAPFGLAPAFASTAMLVAAVLPAAYRAGHSTDRPSAAEPM